MKKKIVFVVFALFLLIGCGAVERRWNDVQLRECETRLASLKIVPSGSERSQTAAEIGRQMTAVSLESGFVGVDTASQKAQEIIDDVVNHPATGFALEQGKQGLEYAGRKVDELQDTRVYELASKNEPVHYLTEADPYPTPVIATSYTARRAARRAMEDRRQESHAEMRARISAERDFFPPPIPTPSPTKSPTSRSGKTPTTRDVIGEITGAKAHVLDGLARTEAALEPFKRGIRGWFHPGGGNQIDDYLKRLDAVRGKVKAFTPTSDPESVARWDALLEECIKEVAS
jgi:hypothetical protein